MGLMVGLVGVFLVEMPIAGNVGMCVTVGLAVGRTFDRSSIRPT